MKNCDITNVDSFKLGGAMFIEKNSKILLENTNVINVTANIGSSIYLEDSDV